MIVITDNDELQNIILNELVQGHSHQKLLSIAEQNRKELHQINQKPHESSDSNYSYEPVAVQPKIEKITTEKYIEGEYTYYKFDKHFIRYDRDNYPTVIKHSCYYRHRPKDSDAKK